MVEAEFVVVAEMPSDVPTADGARLTTSFCLARKQYHLHVQATESKRDAVFINPEALTHYSNVPYEALYSGVFVEEAAMRMYISMFQAEVGPPYAPNTLKANRALLFNKVAHSFNAGASTLLRDCHCSLSPLCSRVSLLTAARLCAGQQLDGLQYLAFHCLLHDQGTVAKQLHDDEPLFPLEELVHSAEQRSVLKALPHIVRVLHSSVSRLSRLAVRLKCLEVLLSRFHELQAITTDPDADEGDIQADEQVLFLTLPLREQGMQPQC